MPGFIKPKEYKMAKLKIITLALDPRDEMLVRILRSNYTKALLKVRAQLTELHQLIADAPAEMPADDITRLTKFVKETNKEIDEMI